MTSSGSAPLILATALLALAGQAEAALATCPNCQRASFGPAVRTIGVDITYAASLVVADFDGDGTPDLAVSRSQGVSVFLGTGGGNFGPALGTEVNDLADVIVVGDFNEDGIPDLAVKKPQGVSLLLGGGSGRFSVGPVVPGNVNVAAIGVGDFDGDGHLDVVTANSGQTVTFLRGDGHGNLTVGGTFPTGLAFPYPNTVAVGDLNGDGRADLVVAGAYPGTSILLGSPAGFGAPTVLDPFQTYGPVQIADVTGDGKPDLVGAIYFGNVVVFPGDGSGGFGAPLSVPMGGDPSSLAIADLDGDGKLDLIAASYQYSNLVIRLGTGGGGFGPIQELKLGNGPNSLAIADLDGDGIPDFLTTDSYSVSLAFGNGTGGILAAVLPMGSEPVSAAIADFDGDGHLDVATVSQGYFRAGTGISVRNGDGHGGLSPELRYSPPLSGGSLTAADMNGDGKPDLVVTGGGITVLLNDGTGAFAVAGTTSTCEAWGPPVVEDFNLDGNLDVAVPCYSTIGVYFGDGAGSFSSSIAITASAIWIAAGDVNGDGKADLVAGHFNSYQISTFLGDGAGHFGAPIFSMLLNYSDPRGLVLGDFDGDGHLDVAAGAFHNGNSLDVIFGDGTGGFGAPRSFPMRSQRVSLAVDLNGDGRPDILALTSGRAEVLMNDGSGNFLPSRSFGGGSSTGAFGDLDEDGLADLVTADSQSDSITVLLNTSCKPRHLAVTPVFPSCSPPGAPLTPAPAVRVLDDGDNVVTCAAGTVTASLLSGPPGAVLSGTTTVPVVSGIATFSNLSLNLAGSNYRLRFTHSGAAGPTTGAAHVGSGTTVAIAGPATVCGNNPALFSAGPGYTAYLWTLDGIPISFTQNATLGFLPAGSHTLAVRVRQGDCEAVSSVEVHNASPQFNTIAPSSGPAAGGTPITVGGACFASGATLSLGGTAATAVNVSGSSSLSATTPGHAPGAVPGVVTNPDGQTGVLAGAYTFVCAVTPTASVSGSAVVCAPTTVHLLVNLTGEPPWTLTWSDGYVQPFVSASPVQRYVTPTSTTTYSITSVVGNFCPGSSTGEATIVVQNCPAGSPAGSLITDGRAVTGTLNPAGNVYVFQPKAGSYGMVEVETAFDGQATRPGGGPAPLIAITRSGGAPLDFAPEYRATCTPDSAGRLFYYASDADLSGGPLEAHVSDPLSSGYRIRVRAMETSLFAPRWSINGYRAFVNLQNTSDCIVEGYIYVLMETGPLVQSYFFSLPPGASVQREIIVSPPGTTKFGSLRVLHDGPAGAITGGVYMTSPAGGASFRWPLQQVRSYGATDGR